MDREAMAGVLMIDSDLQGIWIFHPAGQPGIERTGGYEIVQESWEYGDPPYRFRAYKQNGSRLWLRLLQEDGTDKRYTEDKHASGQRIERRAYTSDMRRGIYWTREGGNDADD